MIFKYQYHFFFFEGFVLRSTDFASSDCVSDLWSYAPLSISMLFEEPNRAWWNAFLMPLTRSEPVLTVGWALKIFSCVGLGIFCIELAYAIESYSTISAISVNGFYCVYLIGDSILSLIKAVFSARLKLDDMNLGDISCLCDYCVCLVSWVKVISRLLTLRS